MRFYFTSQFKLEKKTITNFNELIGLDAIRHCEDTNISKSIALFSQNYLKTKKKNSFIFYLIAQLVVLCFN